MTSPLPKYSIITSDKDLNYLVAINNDKKYNFHYLCDDRVAVLRDCYEDGSLKTIKKNERKCPWVLLTVKEFYDNGTSFDIPVCQKCCPLMGSLSKCQKYEVITAQLCHHARILTNLVRDYKNPYFLDNWLSLSKDFEDGAKIEIIHQKEDKTCSSHHLKPNKNE